MKIAAAPLGPFETNAYLVVAENGKDCCVIDAPKDAGPLLLAEIKKQGLNLTHLLITHGHWDHMCDGHHFAKAGAKGYDNHDPRAWMAQLTGRRARADAAQANSFEAFPFFAVGVIVASLVQVDAGRIQALSVVFVLARLAYIYCYITDKASLRSVVWGVAMACSVALYGSALAL